MRFTLIFILLTCLGFGQPSPALAQSKSRKVRTLENQRKDAQRKADQAEKELQQVRKNASKQKNLLELTKRQLNLRQEYISHIERELVGLQENIDSLQRSATVLLERESKLTAQYITSLKQLHLTQRSSADRLRFLLSASSINQLEERKLFLRRYALGNSQITREIKANRAQIDREKSELDESKQSKESLQQLYEQEKHKLEKEAGQRQQQLTSLQGKEKELNQRIQTHKRQADQLNAQIEAQIEAEIRQAQEAARKAEARRIAQQNKRRAQSNKKSQSRAQGTQGGGQQGSATTQKNTNEDPKDNEEADEPRSRRTISSGYAMNSDEHKLAGSFAQNKGRLPSPVRGRYDLVRRFGVQPYEAGSKVQVNSGGIDLLPHSDKQVYAVFDGVVTRIISSAGYNKSILVRHGNYMTVYANLESVSVSTGQRVKAGTVLGRINSSTQSDMSGKLHFQVWHDRSKLNPSQWLKGS